MNIQRGCVVNGAIVLFLLFSLLSGCASIAYLPGQQTIGKLRIIGPNVQVNSKPGVDGQMITSGDHVTTGAASSAYIYYLSGGFIQLDENTDPGFDLVWEGTQCIIKILKEPVIDQKHPGTGQVYHETTADDCQSYHETLFATWWRKHTQYNVMITPQQSVMTALQGPVELVSPQHITQQQGQQMVVTATGVQSVRQLSNQELKEVTRWRDRFPPPSTGGARRCGACAD